MVAATIDCWPDLNLLDRDELPWERSMRGCGVGLQGQSCKKWPGRPEEGAASAVVVCGGHAEEGAARTDSFEQKRGHVASAIECYMKQYDVSEQQAHDEFQKQVADAWKDINGDCLRPTNMPIRLLTRVINLARVIDVIYKGEDGYTHVGTEMKKRIASLLLDLVLI
ncbi:hypothetical protein F0562_008853 [Nyssa sinensis]|uniref:Terpene synthase metal-binding domain-containing protein n=1 Tax=Nyssa sinensis TaxID=561372 RepID=A0A5J5AA63_9ASTE|nr:hypothetical protein F0562_008853 [Nyssa sinensis]